MPIALDCVTYSYSAGGSVDIPALKAISLTINDGEFVGIMGRTGCGKTTMIQLMAGLLSPCGGRILLDGKDIGAKGYDRSELREKVGIVFQFPEYQLFETTVEKDVAFALKHSGFSSDEIAGRVRWALEAMEFSFEEIRGQSPLALSGGEKRRVAIAGVLVSKPKILIFDEPVAGLDPMGRESFMQIVSRLRRDGTTIIIVSHNADMLGEYAQRLIVLDNGSIVADGTVKEVFSDICRMKSLHLGVSTPRLLAHMLSEKGMPIPQDIVSYSELLSALTKRGDLP